MDMYVELDDLGLGATVTSPDMPGWADEESPPEYIRNALRNGFQWLKDNKALNALGELVGIRDAFIADYPSYAMRRHYYLAVTYATIAEYASEIESVAHLHQAVNHYTQALALAVSHLDVTSQVTLHRMRGEAFHDLWQYTTALSEYQTAFTTLQRFPPAGELTRARAEIKLRMRIARQQYLGGQPAEALENVQRAREVRAQYGGPATDQKDRMAEDWLEAMIVRSESQRSGGDRKMLMDAMALFNRALERAKSVEKRDVSLPRLLIQIINTHLDLAEFYRREGSQVSYRNHMKKAFDTAVVASDMFRDSKDDAGRAMATLALLRYDFLNLKASDLASQIYDLEQRAADTSDLGLLAQAATLRADVLASMTYRTDAVAVYNTAIEAYKRMGAPGEGARAYYGLRRTLDDLYGADPTQ